jgi:hypothetical protein
MMLHPTQELEPPANPARFIPQDGHVGKAEADDGGLGVVFDFIELVICTSRIFHD